METISITQLSPTESPPADKGIRAIVTLFWPFSSSTKQCAFLLAEPDFRLRNRKGQVRVRFTNGSAEAVAKGKVGIGDEVLLKLRGAVWTGETGTVVTPGRSVDGELVFRGKLELTIFKKANGEEVNTRINVNETTPPPDEPQKDIHARQRLGNARNVTATPAKATPSYLRSSLVADVVPIYSSPAFVRRLRLSEESKSNSWTSFVDVEEELEQQPRKKQKIGFGNVGRWKVVGRTPSPEKEHVPLDEDMEDVVQETVEQLSQTSEPNTARLEATDANATAQSLIESYVDQAAEVPSAMPPPSLPKLQMPNNARPLEFTTGENNGPTTPKLQPVPSSALPLPSPFPIEASQLRLNEDTALLTNAANMNAAIAVNQSFTIQPEETTAKPATRVEDSGWPTHNLVTGQSGHDIEDIVSSPSDRAQEAVTSSSAEHPRPVFRDHHYSSQLDPSQIENLSDTEEDEEMYINHMRRRFPTFDERGYRRVDHQEEGYYDDLSEVESGQKEDDDSAYIIVEPGQELDSGEEGSDEDDANNSEVTLVQVGTLSPPKGLVETPQHTENGAEAAKISVPEESHIGTQPVELIIGAKFSTLESQVIQLVGDQDSEHSKEASQAPKSQPQYVLKTPAGSSRPFLGLDSTSSTPVKRTSTPQSERDRIMKRTYSSLFGFNASPSPERKRPEPTHLLTVTPAPCATLFGESPAGLEESQARKPQDKPLVGTGLQLGHEHNEKTPAGTQTGQLQLSEANDSLQYFGEDADFEKEPTAVPAGHVEANAERVDDKQDDRPQWQASEVTAETSDNRQVAEVEDGSLLRTIRENGILYETAGQQTLESSGDHGAPLFKDVGLLESGVDSGDDVIAATVEAAREDFLDDKSVRECSSSPTVDESIADHEAASPDHSSALDDVEMVDAATTEDELVPSCDKSIAQAAQSQAESFPVPSMLAIEDPVPDGRAINKELGEAISFTSQQSHLSPEAPLSSAPPSTNRAEIIDLGSSDTEEEEETASASAQQRVRKDLAPAAESENDGNLGDVPNLDLRQSLLPRRVDAQGPSKTTTYGSQRSAPDTLVTTQTTLDRSEVRTPTVQELDIMMPDSVGGNEVWARPGHQGFFDDQLHATELPGTQLPLTQNTMDTIAGAHNYSFQSATSVATDNSDNPDTHLPPTAVQSIVDEGDAEIAQTRERMLVEPSLGTADSVAVQIPSSSPSGPKDAEHHGYQEPPEDSLEISDNVDSQVTASRHSSPLEHFSRDAEISFSEPDFSLASANGQWQPDFNSEQDQTKVSRVMEFSQMKVAESDHGLDEDASSSEDVGLFVEHQQRMIVPASYDNEPREAQESQTVERRRSYPALAISPEESKHQLKSMPFETQVSSSILPQLPDLTQGDSSTKKQPEVMVENMDTEVQAQVEVETPRRTRQSQRLVIEVKKTPVRRSLRTSHAKTQPALEATEDSQDAQIADDTPARSTRSKTSVVDKATTLSLGNSVPARKSLRKSQMSTIGSEDTLPPTQSALHMAGRPATPEPVQETSPPNNLFSPEKKTPLRRSLRNLQPGKQPLSNAGDVADDAIATDRKYEEDLGPSKVDTSGQGFGAVDVVDKETKHGKADMDVIPESPVSNQTSAFGNRSFAARLGSVPDVISNWFSPRRSVKQQPELPSAAVTNSPSQDPSTFKRTVSTGFATNLSYYTALSNLEQKLNPPSQSIENTVEILAVVKDQTSPPERAKGGPRHFFTVFHVTDSSLQENDSIRVEVYRPWHAKLPTADIGDVVLLRSFAVKSRKRQPYLLSTDSGAWCVWRYSEEQPKPAPTQASPKGRGKARETAAENPVWTHRSTRQRKGSHTTGVREEVKGPPVELGDEERERVAELRTWWVDTKGSGTRAPDPELATKTRLRRV